MKVIDIHAITQTGINSNEKFLDGRPCFGPDGNTVLFERIYPGQEATQQQLWTVEINTNSENLYYRSKEYGCLRASWSWNPEQNSKQIAFTGIYSPEDRPVSRIMLLDENGADDSAIHLEVNGHKEDRLSYPAWYPNEPALLITNYTNYELLKVNINSLDARVLTNANKYYSGMGTVNPIVPRVIAFAGQPKGPEKYNQDFNKILLQVGTDTPVVFSDPTKNIGRGPWFNPKGNIMAFEAHSKCKKLQICIKRVDVVNPQSQPIIIVSNPDFPSQHAKFSPDGSKIIWAQGNNDGKSQIFMGTIIEERS